MLFSDGFLRRTSHILIFLIDDSDIVKPQEEKFRDLGIVRDGSSKNKIMKKDIITLKYLD